MMADSQSVAMLIRQARIARGLSLKDISSDTCVSTFYLKAIEDGDFDKLPTSTYSCGFVKCYAKAVGLDADRVCELFKAEIADCEKVAEIKPITVTPQPKKSFLQTWGAGISGVMGVGLTWVMVGALTPASTGLVADNNQNEQRVVVATSSNDDHSVYKKNFKTTTLDTVENEPMAAEHGVSEMPVSDTPALFPAAHATQNDDFDLKTGKEIVLEATEDSWIRLADTQGTEIWSGVLRKGELYRPTVPETVVLTTSNAGGVRLNLAEKEAAAPLGGRGEILTDFTIKLPK